MPHDFRGTDYERMVRGTGFDGDVIVFRGNKQVDLRSAELPTPTPISADDGRPHPLDVGHDLRAKGRRPHPSSLRVEADTIAAAHDMRAGETLLLPMPITHVAGLTYGVLLPVTSAITAVLMDTWEPARALELVKREHIAVMISTPVFMRTMIDDPSFDGTDTSSVRLFSLGGAGVAPAMVREGTQAFGCWCKRTYGSTEYPTLTTGRLGDDPELDATTDGCLIDRAELRIVDPQTLADRRARCARRAPRARSRDVRRLPRRLRSTPTRSPTAVGSAPATSRSTTASTSRSSTG